MEAAAPPTDPEVRAALNGASRLWWLWVFFGLAWAVVGLVILQFDDASITTVGVIIGAMFLATGFQQFVVWTGGRFFIEKQYLLLVFSGIWALMQGFIDLVRAFQIRKLGELV